MSIHTGEDNTPSAAQAAGQQEERRFRALIEHSADVTALVDAMGNVLYVSPSVTSILGYTPEELFGTHTLALVHPDDLPTMQEVLGRIAQAPGASAQAEYRLHCKDGSWRWVEGRGTNMLHNADVRAIVGNFRDITDRKAAEEERDRLLRVSQENEAQLQRILDSNLFGIIITNTGGHIVQANDCFLQMVGYTREDLEKGRINWSEMTPEEYRVVDAKALEEIARTVVILHPVEKEYFRKDGSRVPVIVGGALFDLQGNESEGICFILDISERKQAEERLQLLNQISTLLVSSFDQQITLPEVAELLVPSLADYCRIALVDEQGKITEIFTRHSDPLKNALAQALYEQYKDIPGVSHGLIRLLETGQAEFIPVITESILMATREFPELHATIEALHLQSYMGIPLVARGRVIGAITFSSIQPRRTYTEEDLLFAQEIAGRIATTLDNAQLYAQAQKAVLLRDEFIATASHELRTPITSLKMYTQVLQKQLSRQGEQSLSGSLTKMDAQITKLARLVGDLLDVSKLELGRLDFREEAVDLNRVIRETVEHVQATSPRHTIEVEGETPPVWGDEERIKQVLTNLLTNAVKYSPNGDRIIVRVATGPEAAEVTVQDFGIGIAPEHQQHIFNRFYRVSDPEERTYPGLGIGLHIAHEIVLRHGGTMSVSSEKGKGSQFRFTLPYAP